MEMIDEIVRVEIGDGRPYVHIVDYTNLRGVTLRARRFYIDFMKKRRNLAGAAYCGVSSAFRLTIQIAKRLRFLTADLEIIDSRADAIEWADAVLKKAAGPPESRLPEVHRSQTTPPKWEYLRSGFEMRLQVVDGPVAQGMLSGHFGSDHVETAINLCRGAASHITSTGAPIRVIVDISNLEGVTVGGRRAFARAFKAFQAEYPIQLMVFCGANVLLRGVIAIWRPLLPFPIVTAKDADSALQIVHDRASRRHRLGNIFKRSRRSSSVATVPEPSDPHLDQLLRFLGNIDWEQDGVADEISLLPRDAPLAPVYDAVTLLKAELDQQLLERRNAEAALMQSEERYRTILEDIADGYYETDLVGNLTFCNDAMLRILGYRSEEIEGRSSRAFMDREHAKRVISEFVRVFDTGRPARALSWELIRKDGLRIAVEASISLVRDQEGKTTGFRGIVRDITERVHAERERDELESRLLHAQRMEAIGTLAGGISHNFNNLLMGIQGNVSLVRRELAEQDPKQRRLATVEDLVQDGSRLTRQLLGYARAGRYEIRVVDVNRLVTRTTIPSPRREKRSGSTPTWRRICRRCWRTGDRSNRFL